MRIRVLAVLFIVLAASVTISLIRGQEGASGVPTVVNGKENPAEPLPIGGSLPTLTSTPATPRASVPPARPAAAVRDFSRLKPLQQQMLQSAQRGADWLFRMNGVKGRFVPGYLPALRQPMEGDHYLRQAGAAAALARAARVMGEEHYAMRATQAVLALLDDTMLDPRDATARYTAMPPIAVDRVASAALLVLAICELPDPQRDLHDRAEQLCTYIRKQSQPSGALACNESADKDEDSLTWSVQAAYALLRHHKQHPAGWKVETARKALLHARVWWKDHKSMTFASHAVAASSEAYLATKDPAFADFAREMSDWLCGLQYTQIELSRMRWYGGFMSHHDGRTVETPPTIESAVYAEGLIDACRVARELGDVGRYQRYRETVERCLQFLTTLQYSDSGTQHFAAWYRPQIVGAFHASHEDGNLRLDWTQHSVTALFGYLEQVVQ